MMYAGRRIGWIRGPLLALLACTGCAVNIEKFAPDEGAIARFDRMTTIEAIKEVNEQLNKAQQSRLEFYAPEHYDLAAKALAQAREFLATNSPRETVVQKVALAEAVLNSADTVARSMKVAMGPELEIKDRLDALNAPKVFGREYGSLVERLGQIIRKLENGQNSDAKRSRENLIPDLQALEARAVVYNALHEAEETIKRVSYRGGEKLAPITFKEATEVLRQADEYIRANIQNRAAIEQISHEALFAAKRALHVTEEVASLGGKVNLSLEQIVLDEEYRLFRVARAISAEDVRNHPLEVQSELLAKNAKELADKTQNQEALVNALRDALGNAKESATQVGELDIELNQLRRERNAWMAKEALFQAQIGELRTRLTQATPLPTTTALTPDKPTEVMAVSLPLPPKAIMAASPTHVKVAGPTIDEPQRPVAAHVEEEQAHRANDVDISIVERATVNNVEVEVAEPQHVDAATAETESDSASTAAEVASTLDLPLNSSTSNAPLSLEHVIQQQNAVAGNE